MAAAPFWTTPAGSPNPAAPPGHVFVYAQPATAIPTMPSAPTPLPHPSLQTCALPAHGAPFHAPAAVNGTSGPFGNPAVIPFAPHMSVPANSDGWVYVTSAPHGFLGAMPSAVAPPAGPGQILAPSSTQLQPLPLAFPPGAGIHATPNVSQAPMVTLPSPPLPRSSALCLPLPPPATSSAPATAALMLPTLPSAEFAVLPRPPAILPSPPSWPSLVLWWRAMYSRAWCCSV